MKYLPRLFLNNRYFQTLEQFNSNKDNLNWIFLIRPSVNIYFCGCERLRDFQLYARRPNSDSVNVLKTFRKNNHRK
jgi:hypothetical protein